MTGNKEYIVNFKAINGPKVVFGGNEMNGQTKGMCELHFNRLVIKDIAYVENLKFNLVNTNQFFDKGYFVEFSREIYCVHDEISKEIVLCRIRKKNMYIVDWDIAKSNNCLIAKGSVDLCWE